MDYKSKFKGAEIDAHLEKMVNVTYAELKALRDEGKLIAGQMYRMTDYETTCTWADTHVAGHPFDLVLTALDNKTLDEKCSAIWSERDKDGYFANSNLAAWDVRYCMDNDVARFMWASQEGKFLIAYDEWDEYAAVQDGTIEINGVTYVKWSATNGRTILCTKTATPQYGEEIIVMEIGYEDYPRTAFVSGIEERVDGKGVIYRLIDESENSVPYDFKNIMFKRPLTNGKYDAENGVDTFCYTFCCIDGDTYAIEDQSVREPQCCYNNKFDVYCYDNVFLTFSGDYCYSNAFGGGCFPNTFGSFCYSNTFGDGCYSNTFGSNCRINTLGDSCYRNEFGNDCSGNIVGAESYDNILGDTCLRNTIGSYNSSNTLGQHCYDNIFGQHTYGNTLGDYCFSNTFLNNCYYNTFEDNETASEENMIQYYKVDCVKRAKIDVFRGRNYQTFVTTNSNGSVVEYTVDSIATNSNTPS